MTQTSLATDRLGAVKHHSDGRVSVIFERRLAYPIEHVWAALIDAKERALWWPGFNIEPRLGGRFEMRFSGDCDGPAELIGTVTQFEPPNILACGTACWKLAEDNGQASASDRWTGKIRIVHMSDTFMLKLRRVRSCKTLRQLLVVR